MLSKEKIEEELRKIGIEPPKIVFYNETDSTNIRAKEYARSTAERETVVFIAERQSAGRGRLGRSFVSKGGGIYMSILTYPKECGFDATRSTAEAAVGLARATDSLCGCKTDIKWVNDIFLGGKKLAGILTEGEMDSEGKIAFQVVGMGINIYKKAISEEIKDIATSIEEELENVPDSSALTARIIAEVIEPKGNIFKEYKARSLVIGKRVKVQKATESYYGEVIDINPDYSLRIKTDSGIQSLFTGEVSLRLND